MVHLRLSLLAVSALSLAACGTQPVSETNQDTFVRNDIPPALSSSGLLRLPYTITDTTVRTELSRVGLGFSVKLKNGTARISSPRSVFQTVRADAQSIVYGDVNGDGVTDAILPLSIGDGHESFLEIAAVKTTASGAVHFASFPLGQATLRSLNVTNGKIRVNYTHTVAGDPGPRNTELLLELPR